MVLRGCCCLVAAIVDSGLGCCCCCLRRTSKVVSSANFASKIFVFASSSVDGLEEEEKSRVVMSYE